MKKSKKKILLLTTAILFSLLVIADIAATYYFYGIAFVRDNTPVSQTEKTSKNYPLVTRFDKLEKTSKTLENGKVKLKAWYVPAQKKTDKTVIVVHGFRQDKSAMRQYGQLFHELGYNVLMPDNRAAGESSGTLISYGYEDSKDIIAWAKELTQENPQSSISLFGLSMGAATVMMASGQPGLPASVKNIIEDCGYSNVWSEVVYQADASYKIPPFPLVYSVSLMNKVRQGWFLQEADAPKALAKNKIPILMIHGDSDDYVPSSMVYDNYQAVKEGTAKEILVVKTAKHAKSFETDPALYRQRVSDFMTKYN